MFALLSFYLDDGPFEFDASALSERLAQVNPTARVNPEQLAALQPQLERFFDISDRQARPRPGVPSYEPGAHSSAHVGQVPGEATRPPS